VRVVMTDTIDAIVPIDKRKLEQVIDNLLDNAIEASPAGAAVDVAITHDGMRAHVTVRDRGAGVDTHAACQLFTPFYTTKPDGIGLGLVLARELACAHGGDVRHEAVDTGALFVLEVPLEGAAQ
jgi:two-component system sensor histidine kinase FlrB